MLPAGKITEATSSARDCIEPDDTIIDGGNTFWQDDVRRGKALKRAAHRHVDVGTSGGVWGLERGYCMMIGGDKAVVERLDPDLCNAGAGHRRIRAPQDAGPVRKSSRDTSMPARSVPGTSSR